MRIKFGDIKINEASKKHIEECLKSNHVTMGPKVKLLEKLWAEKFGYKEVRAVSSGTAACIAACLALYDFGANPGDEIIVPGLSFIATANAVRAAGFKPVFCDIKEGDMVIDEEKIEELMCHKTRAIMPVSLMGKPAKMDFISKLAKKYNVKVIVDNCEGHGCLYKNKPMSHWADIVVYSCYAAHILFSGELGLVGCKDKKTADIIESVRSHGRPINSLYFNHERYGLNLKPTDLHASIGLGSLEEFDDILRKRKLNLCYLREGLKDFEEHFWFCEEEIGSYNSPHAFSITIKPNTKLDIVGLQKVLDDYDIEWKRNFGAMNKHKCFNYLYDSYDCPNASYVGNNGLHIGVHQGLTMNDLNRIISAVTVFVRR